MVVNRMKAAEGTGIHTTATTLKEYQPAATHGIVVEINEQAGLLSALTLGLWPYSIETSARLMDLRTGEVRASLIASSWGWMIASGPGGVYRGLDKIAKGIAKAMHNIQDNGRHLRHKDWPTNYQQDSSDPSAQGRFTHAVYLVMMGFDDQALAALEEAVHLDRTMAEKARHAWEFEPLRDNVRFQAITRAENQKSASK